MLPRLFGNCIMLTLLPVPLASGDGRVPVPFRIVFETPWAAPMPGRKRTSIADLATWQTTWRTMTANQSPSPAPAIDFTRETAVLLAMGSRRTTGYRIKTTAVNQVRDTLVVSVLESSPGACNVGDAFTSPVTVIAIARVGRPVRFIERTRTECALGS